MKSWLKIEFSDTPDPRLARICWPLAVLVLIVLILSILGVFHV